MPFMITKNGERIDLTIHDNIPYVDLGTYECTPHECHHASKIHDLLTHSQVGFNDFNDIDDVGQPSRRVHLDGESGLETSIEDHKLFPICQEAQGEEEEKSNEPAKTFGNSWRRRRRTT